MNKRRFFSKHRFSHKLLASYLLALLLLYSAFFAWFLIWNQKNITAIYEENLLSIARNATTIANLRLADIQKTAEKINTDDRVIQILSTVDYTDATSLLAADKQMQLILYSLFDDMDYIYNAQLVTRSYRFGINDLISSFPSDMFYQSEVFHSIEASRQPAVWVPTYDLSQEMPDHYYKYLDANTRTVFSLVQALHLIRLEAGKPAESVSLEEVPYLLLSCRTDFMEDLLAGLPAEASCYLLAPDGTIVYHQNPNRLGEQITPQAHRELPSIGMQAVTLSRPEGNVLVCSAPLPTPQWMFYIELPLHTIFRESVTQMLQVLFLFSLLTLPLFVVMAWRLSAYISLPIVKLEQALQEVEQGNFGHRIDFERQDELGNLVKSFNQMSTQIETLIHENYETKLKQQDAELRMLNLHFNPHFIYNTLGAIYWILEQKGEEESAGLIMALIQMLRSSSRCNTEFWPLRQEIEWLNNYVLIMASRQGQAVELVYFINESLLDYPILKHLLQPFVENAMIHGFSNSGSGRIEIFATQREQYLTLRIVDNGAGFDPGHLREDISSGDDSGMTVRSHKRIQLAYGTDCGIQILSTLGQGTEVIITICAK